MLSRKVDTRQGRVAVLESPGNGMPVLLIHGNSSCRAVFERQFETDFAKVYRIVAVDLLGHGESDNAREPRQAYTVPGHAAVLIDVLRSLDIQRAALLGWSLGGHIGLEMIGQGFDASGIMIVGTPPVRRGVLGMVRGFQTQLDLLLATRSLLRPQEIERFARISVGETFAPRFYDAIARTDVRARPVLARGMMTGVGVDQRWLVENTPTPVAVVNGSNEPFARLDYLSSLGYQNLWGGRCHIIEGAGHAPFLETPEPFNRLFSSFLDDASHYHATSAGQHPAHRVA
jgi:pimeloyl-ACP methyl ester carboxylesterase